MTDIKPIADKVVWELESAKRAHIEAFDGDSSALVSDEERGKANKRLWAAVEATLEAAALDSPPDHGGGEGWVMVPREPTMAMMAAGADRVDDSMAHANAVYRAMLASLPTQESEDGR